jgi:hypothetical protein
MNPIRTIRSQPLQTINYTELVFAFVAHILTIPYIGVLTGLICGCAVHYTIQIQRDGTKPATRRQAFYGTLLFKIGQLWIHQTSFLFMFTVSGKTLPFGWALDVWAWITTVFIFSIDVWALSVTSQEAAEAAETAEIEASTKRMEEKEAADRAAQLEREAAERQARADRDAADRAERLELARIKAEAEKTAKLAAEETARKLAEEQRKAAEVAAEVERTKVEAEQKSAELKWKREEEERNLAEQRRKEAEEARKSAEAEKKRAEAERKAEEAKNRLEREAAEKAAVDKEQAEIAERRAKWRNQKAKKSNHNGHRPETAINQAIEA